MCLFSYILPFDVLAVLLLLVDAVDVVLTWGGVFVVDGLLLRALFLVALSPSDSNLAADIGISWALRE
jgi:hypothetical protein